jgi:signal peptidase II
MSEPLPPFFSDRKKWIIFVVVALLSLVADQATKMWARSWRGGDGLPVVYNSTPSGETRPSTTDIPSSSWVKTAIDGHHQCVIPDDLIPRPLTNPAPKPAPQDWAPCHGHPVPFVDGYWDWELSMNPGSAFGLFARNNARIFLSIVGIAAVLGMIWMLRKARKDQRVLHWALALVAGGAIGNLVDRIYYGVVTDFVLLHYHYDPSWPVFNVADIVLVVGVGLMFIDIQKEGKREKALRAARQDKVKAAGLVKDLTE